MTRRFASLISRVVLPLALITGTVGATDTYYSVPTPGNYAYGDGSAIVLGSGDRFWFQGGSAGDYTLANDFTVNNGTINWSGGSATKVFFDGNLTLNGNLTLSSDMHNPGRRADFTGNILLVGGDRTITSTTSTYTSNAPTLFGTINGNGIHSVTLNAPFTDRGMGIGGSGGWNVKNVILDTGYIHLVASNASDDFFSGVRNNGGKVSLVGGTPVSIYKGTYDFNSDFTVTSGTVEASTITVQSGGTIGGIGRFVAPIVVQSGGYLAPGNSPGQLFVVGNLTLAGGANYAVEIVTGSQVGNGISGYDQTVVTGAVSLDGANLLVTADMFGLQRGQLLIIIANHGVDLVVGTFAGLPEGSTVDIGGTGFFTISYNAFGLGNDVVLRSLVPEPTSLALLGLAGLLARRRRR